MNDALLTQTAEAIKRYLARCPAAADTTEGVHHWWIDWPQLPPPLAVTQAALEQLEQQGWVIGMRSGNRTLWRKAA